MKAQCLEAPSSAAVIGWQGRGQPVGLAGDISEDSLQAAPIEMLGAEEKVNLMINLMPSGEPLPTDYAYSYRAA